MNRLPPKLHIFRRALACTVLAHACAHAATFDVTTTADAGKGSLRQAILDANSSFGGDTITFSIPGSGEQVIKLATELPQILGPVTIDGYTQPGAARNTRDPGFDASVNIVVDGSAVAPVGGIFTETYGLTFRKGAEGSTLSGVKVSGFTHGVVLANVDSVTVEGSKLLGNRTAQVVVSGNDNAIGVAGASGRNLIAGRESVGILVAGERNAIRNNYIGFAEPIGEKAGVEYGLDGVLAYFGYIRADYPSAAVSGADLICNPGKACGLAFWSNHHQIGGREKGQGNAIVGQMFQGVETRGSSREDKFGAVMHVEGNLFGARFDGTRDRAYANFFDLYLSHVGPSAIVIQDNALFDGMAGVVVGGGKDPVSGVRIARNRIVGHQRIAIDLGDNGRDSNDPLDADGGDNQGQNFPVLAGAGNGWRLESAPSQDYTLEFFQSASCKVPEADVFLGAFQVVTDAQGVATFGGPLGTLPGGFVTATATDKAGNTSELSECVGAPKLKSKVEITFAKSGLKSGSWGSRFEMRVDGGGLFTPTGPIDLWFVDASGARTRWIGTAGLSGGTATWTDIQLVAGAAPLANTPGAFRVHAEYAGDQAFDASTSSPVGYRVYDVKHTFMDMGVSDLVRANLATSIPDTFEILAGSDVQGGVTDRWSSIGLAPGKRIVAAGKFVRGYGQSLYLVTDAAGNMTVEKREPSGAFTVRPVTGWFGGTVVDTGRFFNTHQQGIVVRTGQILHEGRLLSDTYGTTLPVVRIVQLVPAPRTAGITSASVAAVGDFDGDGNDDILWEVDGALEVQMMDGSTRRGAPVGMPPPVLQVGGAPVAFSLAGAGDFDGDGRTDLVWVGGDSYYVMLMDGTAMKEPLSDARVLPIGAGWVIQAIADYDGDGKADLLWRWEVQGLNLITYMDGSGSPPRTRAVQTFLPLTTNFIDP